MSDRTSTPEEMPTGPIVITGATGFLGGVLVSRLLASGIDPARLRCVVRDVERAKRCGLPAPSLVAGDLSDASCVPQLRAAADGAEVVVHLAGSLKAYDRRGYDDVNVHGTGRLVTAVQEAAPGSHFVHVSSLAAAGPSVDGRGSADPAERCTTVSDYGESKRQGELLVAGSGMPFTVLRPPVVYGPNDGATRLLFRQATSFVTAVPREPRPLSVIHADDVAEALWLAVAQRPEGAVVPLSGPETTDTHALMRAIATACGRKARLLPVPIALAGVAATFADLWARLTSRPGYFNRDKVREIRAPGWVADGEVARACLGFTAATKLAGGLAAVARSEGFVK